MDSVLHHIPEDPNDWICSTLSSCQTNVAGNMFCPLCPTSKFKPANKSRLRSHLMAGHVKLAVTVEGTKIVPCYWDCREGDTSSRGHYHCLCGHILARKGNTETHIEAKHTPKTSKSTPQGKKTPSTTRKRTFETSGISSLKGSSECRYFCCDKCNGLFAASFTFNQHKSRCSGNIEEANCEMVACDKTLFLKFILPVISGTQTTADLAQPSVPARTTLDFSRRDNFREGAVKALQDCILSMQKALEGYSLAQSYGKPTSIPGKNPKPSGCNIRRDLENSDEPNSSPVVLDADEPPSYAADLDTMMETDEITDANTWPEGRLRDEAESTTEDSPGTTTMRPVLRSKQQQTIRVVFPETSTYKEIKKKIIMPVSLPDHQGYHYPGGRNYSKKCVSQECRAGFVYRRPFNQYVGRHKRFSCQECGKTFARPYDRDRHARFHAPDGDVKMFSCSSCEYTCHYSNSQREHMRKHTGEWYQCEELDCNFETIYQRSLDHHMNTVHNEKKHLVCDMCGYRSNDSSLFERHVRLHTKRSVKSSRSAQVGDESERAVENYMYKCAFCDFTQPLIETIQDHMAVEHTEQVEGEILQDNCMMEHQEEPQQVTILLASDSEGSEITVATQEEAAGLMADSEAAEDATGVGKAEEYQASSRQDETLWTPIPIS